MLIGAVAWTVTLCSAMVTFKVISSAARWFALISIGVSTDVANPGAVALTVYVPPTMAGLGGVDVNEIVCAIGWMTVKF